VSKELFRRHVEEGPDAMTFEEVTAALDWRDANKPEAIELERNRQAQRQVDETMEDVRAAYLEMGGTEEDYKRLEKDLRQEVIGERAKAAAEAARAESQRQMWRSF
jgi:hypothetical protein